MTRTNVQPAVNYNILDPFKILGMAEAYYTKGNCVRLGLQEMTESRGESVYLLETPEMIIAHVIEGIGTEPDVAEEVLAATGKSHFFSIAISTVATILNDLVTSGAMPASMLIFLASGRSEWFANKERNQDFLHGWKVGCMDGRVNWGGGESQALRDIVYPDKVVIAGSAVGILRPKRKLIRRDVRVGDAIMLVGSSGVHDNGLTDSRDVARDLVQGYQTKLPSGMTYGEALLKPTIIYARLIEECQRAGIKIRYAINITGHGWRKLMRLGEPFAYIIDTPGEPHEVFTFIEGRSGFNKKKMFGTFNMGAGYALIVRRKDVKRVCALAHTCNMRIWHAGYVAESKESRVEIRLSDSEKVEFHADELKIR